MNRLNSKHHLLFPAAEWLLRPEAAFIRKTHSLIPRMTRADHDYMHNQVPIVPALGHRTLISAGHLWTPEGDTIRDIDGLCIAIGKAAAHERTHRIEADLAELAIEALQMEKAVLGEVEFV